METSQRNRWSLLSITLFVLSHSLLWLPTTSLAIEWSSVKGSKNLWHFRNEQYVRLEPQYAPARPNQHPVTLEPTALRTALASLEVNYKDKILPAFNRSDLDIIVDPLQQGLAQATPSQDVTFAVLGMHPGLFANENRLVTGRVFYQDEQLHIIFGALQREVDYHQDRRIHPFLAGTRQTAQTFERALQLEPGQQFVGQRQDWVALDISAVLAHEAYQAELQPEVVAAETAKVQQEAAALRQEVQALKQTVSTLQQPTTAPAKVTASAAQVELQHNTVELQDAVAELQAQVQTLKSQQPLPVPSPPSANTMPPSSIENRLRVLQDLRAKGLVTEQEYQEKRQQILDEL